MTARGSLGGRRRRLIPRIRPLVSGLVVASVAGLVTLHLAVLWDRVTHGRLSDPEIGLRWLGAAVLTVALVALRRLGVPLLWGRRALVFWLLVLLLHAGAAGPEAPGLRTDPERLLFVVPASVAPLGLLLVLLLAQGLRRAAARPAPCRTRAPLDGSPVLHGGVVLALAPRGPPA